MRTVLVTGTSRGGFVATEFAKDAFDFFGDPSHPDYGPLLKRGLARLLEANRHAIDPGQVAAMVEQALSDEGPRLRYPVGPDAVAVQLNHAALS